MTDSPTGPYKDAGDYGVGIVTYTTAITSQAFDLSGCAHPVLTFRHDYRIAQGDICRVEISTDGGTVWTELGRYPTGAGAGGLATEAVSSPEWADANWKDVEISLSPYTGTVRLRFSLEADRDYSARGWVLDDMLVRSGGATPGGTGVYLPVIVRDTSAQ